MSEFKKRRTAGAELVRVGAGCLGVAALGALVFVAGRGALDMYGKFAEAAAARAGAQAQLAELDGRYQKVKTEVDTLSTDRGLEGAARERYGVALPGEGQINIVRPASTTEPVAQKNGVFEKLWNLLFVW
jgi:cell division protein FtsB